MKKKSSPLFSTDLLINLLYTFFYSKMNEVEHCVAQLATLDLNNQDKELTKKYSEISKMIKSANSPNRTISVIATGKFPFQLKSF